MTVDQAELDGYQHVRLIKFGRIMLICGLRRMAFTTGLFIGVDETGYKGRYCFNWFGEALDVLKALKEIPKDLMIEGNWLKYKGDLHEIINPKYEKDEDINAYTGIERISMLIQSNFDNGDEDNQSSS